MINKQVLCEFVSPRIFSGITESEEVEVNGKKEKNLYLKGIFIQGDVKNANQRIYPAREIERAVTTIREQIKNDLSILGEADHPDDLKINLDRVSHVITDMWMDGANGLGKLKIIPTPMGQIIKTMLESGVKLGVSSRGSGNVDDLSGKVSEFEIVTVDVVAQPSAPNAFPTAVYEGVMNMNHGHKILTNLKEGDLSKDVLAQKYLRDSVLKIIKDLKLR